MRKFLVSILILTIFAVQFSFPSVLAASTPSFQVNCGSVYMINTDTNTVVYSKNANKRIYPASTTKLMTAILTVEKFKDKMNTPVTFTHEDINSLKRENSGLFVAGETLTVEQLLNCMLVESVNEAAVALARTVGGNEADFVAMMNKKAKEIGAVDTHFMNPHGLQDPDHYSTAYDIYLIAHYATTMKDGTIAGIVSQTSYDLAATNKHPVRTLVTTNKLLGEGTSYYYRYCKGIKTGTTTQAGYCLASYAVKNGITYYCVAMDAPKTTAVNRAFTDTRSLYQWAYSTFQMHTVLDTNEHLFQVNVLVAANNNSKLWLYPDRALETLAAPGEKTAQSRNIVIHSQTQVLAPVKIGQKLGTADVYLSGQKIGTVNLVASEAIARSSPAYFLYSAGQFFSSFWFKLICAVITVLFIGYISLTVHLNRRKKETFNLRKGSKKYRVK